MVSNVVTTLAGKGKAGPKDGKISDASFNEPHGLGLLPDGSILVIDNTRDDMKTRVRKISPDGKVSTLGKNAKSGLKGKKYKCIAVDKNGVTLLAEDCRIDTFSLNGKVSTFVDLKESDGVSIHGMAIDDEGNVFISEFDWESISRIRQVSPDGEVVILVGGTTIGFDDGQGVEANFFYPSGLAVDANRNVFVADTFNHRIRKISPSGEVTTLAGNGHRGNDTGNGNSGCLRIPSAVAVDGDGNVVVADTYNNRILKITSEGFVSVLAGNGDIGYVDGPGTQAQFNYPQDVVVDNQGNVLVSDTANHCIRVIAAGLTPPKQSSSQNKGESSKTSGAFRQ